MAGVLSGHHQNAAKLLAWYEWDSHETVESVAIYVDRLTVDGFVTTGSV